MCDGGGPLTQITGQKQALCKQSLTIVSKRKITAKPIFCKMAMVNVGFKNSYVPFYYFCIEA